ncbi:type II toxin-antitoxin system RatA family toxin [Stigmatella aurantiaca]|uniref:type II toxin-antitoxin system RatA family toxin n=1 Tax=Stigmatella aurantiaca TaxID=41 RepID=UPI000B0260D0|nr:SRPBCC family protein [Stigmatella aurantiaca]
MKRILWVGVLILVAAVGITALVAPKEVRLHSAIRIERPPEQVYDFVTSLEAPAKTFSGHGRIPGVVKTEVVGGGPLREGVTARVHSSDGAVMERLITIMDRPRHHEYRLASGFKPPIKYLLKSGRGEWTFQPAPEGGTQVEWIYVFELTSPVIYPLASPLLNGMFAEAMVKCLARTKECLVDEASCR